MRIIVVSDTHGNYDVLDRILTHRRSADACIHLGDGEREANLALSVHPEWLGKFFYVKGNCDYGSPCKDFLTLDIVPGHRIFATHGHRYGANFGTEGLLQAANEHHCDIILYGHTHVQECSYQNEIYIINPGSASRPRDGKGPAYAFIDFTKAGVVPVPVSL